MGGKAPTGTEELLCCCSTVTRQIRRTNVCLCECPCACVLSQVCQVFAGLSQLSWLNLPMVAATKPLLPLLHKLPALEQLYLQVCGCMGVGWWC